MDRATIANCRKALRERQGIPSWARLNLNIYDKAATNAGNWTQKLFVKK